MSWARSGLNGIWIQWLEVTGLRVDPVNPDKISSKIRNENESPGRVDEDSVGVGSILSGSVWARTGHGVGPGLQLLEVTMDTVDRVSCHG